MPRTYGFLASGRHVWNSGIFPNDTAVVRLVGVILIENNDKQAITRRCTTLETVANFGDAEQVTPPAIAEW